MNCRNCGAPLPAKSNICTFCQTLNDVDLRNIPVSRGENAAGRKCPRCSIPLEAMIVQAEGKLVIDRCRTCHGIFFDPGELEALIDAVGKAPPEADLLRLNVLIEEELPRSVETRKYVACPDCGKLMNRRAYGEKSGVVADRCREHGVWLDGGELGQIRKWVRAGGLEYARKRQEEKKRIEEREQRRRAPRVSDLEYEVQESLGSPWTAGLPFGSRETYSVLRLLVRILT
jgi:Zn-finger nucleic acid-binding protein